MSEVTRLLEAIGRGEPQPARQLVPIVYEELRRLAKARLAHEPPGHTIQATALVHEAYLRLVGDGHGPAWDNRGHFFAAAAEAMRRILVEKARRKRRRRHGGGLRRVDLDQAAVVDDDDASADLLALHDALDHLAAEEPIVAEVVKLRYFAGLTADQAARPWASPSAPPIATGPTPAPGSTAASTPPATRRLERDHSRMSQFAIGVKIPSRTKAR